MIDDAADPALRRITELVVLTPDERRAERFRQRCRAQIRRTEQPPSMLGPALLASVCVVYLCALLLDLLRLDVMF